MAVVDPVLAILGRSLVSCAPESGPQLDLTGRLLTHNWFSLRLCYSSVSIDSYSVAKFLT
jgi:hypothetical protein